MMRLTSIWLILLSLLAQICAQTVPLSFDELMALINVRKLGEVSEERIIAIIAERGIGFKLLPARLDALRKAGASEAVIEAVMGKVPPAKPSQITAGQASTAKPKDAAKVQEIGGKLKTLTQGAQSWDEFIADLRNHVLDYTNELPNFICEQVTYRYLDAGGGGRWLLQDKIVAELTYNEQRESYRILTINGRPTERPFEALEGTRSTGEFGTILRALFSPAAYATFSNQGEGTVRGRRALVIAFQVPQETSGWTLTYENRQSVTAAYRGTCWVDKERLEVLKLDQEAVDLPPSFPITYARTVIDYDHIKIEDKTFLLPVRAEVIMNEERQRLATRNVMEFRNYHKFEVTTRIIPGQPVKN